MTEMVYPEVLKQFSAESGSQQSFQDKCDDLMRNYKAHDRNFHGPQLDRALQALAQNAEGRSDRDMRDWLVRYLNNNPFGHVYRDMRYNTALHEVIQSWQTDPSVLSDIRRAYVDMLESITRPQYAYIFIEQAYLCGLNARSVQESLLPEEQQALDTFYQYDVLAITMKAPAWAVNRMLSNGEGLDKSDMQPPFVSLYQHAENFMRSVVSYDPRLPALHAQKDSARQKEPV